MRPLELVIEGFRSFAERTEIDWRGRRLVGVVGPIGSGKTSILDAVAFALYGKTPVFERESRALIRHGRDRARVELLFEADGETWRVIRVIRRAGAGRHVLYRVGGDGEGTAECEKERQVTARVEELLGLDFATFCRSVLLAQNRFAEFLHASPGDRDKVLKGVFGFDRLDDMHARAKERRARAELDVQKLEGRLSTLDDDRRRLEEARRVVEGATEGLRVLEEAAPEVRELTRREDEARRQASDAGERRGELVALAEELPTEDEVATCLDAVDRAGAELERREGERRERESAAAKAAEEHDRTAAETGTSADHARAEGRLETLRRARAELERQERRRAELEAEDVRQAAAVAQAETAVTAATEADAAARREAEEARAALLEGHDARVVAAEAVLAAVREAFEMAQDAEAEGAANLERREAEARRAEEALRRAEHAEMAQTLARTLEPGKPCPVCEQPVKTVQVRMPATPAEDARGALEAARAAVDEARRRVVELSRETASRRQAVTGAERVADAARAERAAIRAEHGEGPETPDATPEPGDPEERLGTAEKALEGAAAAERRAADHRREAGHAVDLARERQASAAAAAEAVRVRLAAAEDERRAAESQVGEARAGVEEILGEGDPEELLSRARLRLASAEASVAATRDAAAAASREVEAARERLAGARSGQDRLASRLARLAGRLGQRDDDLPPRRLAAAVRERLAEATASAEAAVTSAATEEEGARRERRTLLERLGLDPGADFEAALASAGAAQAAAAARVEELDERLERAGEVRAEHEDALARLDVYRRLSDDLTASHFLRYLLDEERKGLAELGSERFELLSEGRYRFTQGGGFEVVDQHNASEERRAETLSGGETFLASLALALALAEKVTAGGGRLDAFFLDEGFGSLDPQHLDLAMQGIERLVTDSPRRLVTVVSHVPEMRERIEDIIELDKDPQTGATVIVRGRIGGSAA